MYDTVHLWLPIEWVKDRQALKYTSNKLTKVKEIVDAETGEVTVHGKLDNLSVSLFGSGISIKGSICKYYFSDNLKTLYRSDVERAIQMLSDILLLPVEQAKVTRLDIAQNFIMKFPVDLYYSYLGEARHYIRLEQPKSIYYNNCKRVLHFYNKIAESKSKGVAIPEHYQKRHLLRYEMRFIKRVSEQFKSEVEARSLYDECFYSRALTSWLQEYKQISKRKDIMSHPFILKSPKTFERYLARIGIQALGEESVIMEMINNANSKGIFKDKMQINRLKNRLKAITQSSDITIKSEVISELDMKVQQAVKFYR